MSAFRQTEAGKRRDFLTGLFLESADTDISSTVGFLCNELTVADLEDAAERFGVLLPDEESHAEGTRKSRRTTR